MRQQSGISKFLTGLVEDYARSYDIDGLMWGSERQGAMCDSIGATHDTPPVDPGEVTCFCEFCQAKAKQRGVNPDRAKEGFLELEKYVRACRSRQAAGRWILSPILAAVACAIRNWLRGKCFGPTVCAKRTARSTRP